MRPCPAVAIALLLALAACAGPSGSGQVTSKTNPNGSITCGATMLGHNFRPGEDLQMVFTVKADSQWCFDGTRLGNTITEGQALALAPAHGDARIEHVPGAIIFAYRPAKGFTGSDHFRISIPAEIETIYLSVHPTVIP